MAEERNKAAEELCKVFVKAVAELASPLSVSNGREDRSDRDVIRDFDGNPFMPGTSIAGALRAYLASDDADRLFGKATGAESLRSPIMVYDARIEDMPAPAIRDGIELNDDKITERGAKYDYEIIEAGRLEMRFEMPRKGEYLSGRLYELFAAVNRGEIRFGHKKNRGFGRLKITKLYEKKYGQGEAFYDFDWDKCDWDKCPAAPDSGKLLDFDESKAQYDIISVPLKLCGGVSIRRYSSLAGRADYEHITRESIRGESNSCDGGPKNVPVIPGTSWNGALRHRAKRILEELGIKNASEVIANIFGSTDKEIGASKLVIGESAITGGTPVAMTRNRIDRFTGGTAHGALYTEIGHFGGACKLEIMIKRCDDTAWIKGLLHLALKDLENGFLAIGGETAIGRGIFELDGAYADEAKIADEIKAFTKKFPEVLSNAVQRT